MARRKKESFQKNELFQKAYYGFLAEKTLKEYVSIVKAIEVNKLVIKSKSRWLQVQSVLNKCNEAGIELDYKLMKWGKKENNKLKKIEDKVVYSDLFDKLLNELPNTDKGNELRLASKIAYFGGLRLSEVLNLTKKNIKLTDTEIRLSFIGKGDKSRIAYLPLSMMEEIKAFEGFSISLNYTSTMVRRKMKRLGIESSFHGLRHSYATNLINKGVPINTIQGLLGHSDIKTTSIYLHLNQEKHDSLKAIGY